MIGLLRNLFRRLMGGSFNSTRSTTPSLKVIPGGKVELREFDKSTHYNPREFRTDKGPRK